MQKRQRHGSGLYSISSFKRARKPMSREWCRFNVVQIDLSLERVSWISPCRCRNQALRARARNFRNRRFWVGVILGNDVVEDHPPNTKEHKVEQKEISVHPKQRSILKLVKPRKTNRRKFVNEKNQLMAESCRTRPKLNWGKYGGHRINRESTMTRVFYGVGTPAKTRNAYGRSPPNNQRGNAGQRQVQKVKAQNVSTNDRGSMAKPLRLRQVNDGGPSDHTRSVQPKPYILYILKKMIVNIFL